GRVRRGDLRGGRAPDARPPDHELGVRRACAAPRVLRAAEREGRAGASALARRAPRVPQATRRRRDLARATCRASPPLTRPPSTFSHAHGTGATLFWPGMQSL